MCPYCFINIEMKIHFTYIILPLELPDGTVIINGIVWGGSYLFSIKDHLSVAECDKDHKGCFNT